MERFAKQATPAEMAQLAAEFNRMLGFVLAKAEDIRYQKDNKYIVQMYLGMAWNPFHTAGLYLAQAVLGSKEVPEKQRSNLDKVSRLFISAVRMPNKPIEWLDKNIKLLNFLYDAATKWPEKTEGDQKFPLGPFTVHNTMGLDGADLEGTKSTLERASILIKGLNVPGIDRILYGDVMIVGRLHKGNTLAWYAIAEDVVYLRPFKNAGADELHNVIHELGHRYLRKFVTTTLWDEWKRYHDMMRWQPSPTVKLPEVGEPLPFDVTGFKQRPIVHKIVGLDYFVDERRSISRSTIKQFLESEAKYPTPYSAQSAEEHFCEAMALRAMGKLKEPNLSAFKFIVEDGKTGWNALKLGTALPPGWTTTHGEAGRPNYTSPDEDVRIQDSGRGPERFQILYIKDGKFLEDIGWPSLRAALEYLAGKRNIGEHPKHRPTESDRLRNQRVREENQRDKSAMASTYTMISRDALEDWLNTIPLHHKWHIKPGKAGVYLLPLSDTVAVKLSSTIGTSDDAMGRGQASMQLALISLVTGQVLNKKAQGQSHFARTTNWQKNWRTGFDRMKEAYMKAEGFYDALAAIKDRDQYKKDLLEKIESVPTWRNDRLLSDFHDKLLQNGILTGKQQDLLDRTIERSPKGEPAPLKNVPMPSSLRDPPPAPKPNAAYRGDWVLVPNDPNYDEPDPGGNTPTYSTYTFTITGPDNVEYEEYQTHMDGGDVIDAHRFNFQQASDKWHDLLRKRYVPPKSQTEPPFLKAPPVLEDPLVQVLRDLYHAAQRAQDGWLMDFTKSVAGQIQQGRTISPKQMDIINKSRSRFRVASRYYLDFLRRLA